MDQKKANRALRLILHPYMFALREGKSIKEDLLDYSLLILQVSSPQIIKSPSKIKKM
jgi:hypothetical protein